MIATRQRYLIMRSVRLRLVFVCTIYTYTYMDLDLGNTRTTTSTNTRVTHSSPVSSSIGRDQSAKSSKLPVLFI